MPIIRPVQYEAANRKAAAAGVQSRLHVLAYRYAGCRQEGRLRIDRRYVVSGRRRYDRRAMRGHEYIRHDDKPASRLAPKGRDGRFDFYIDMNGRSDWHNLE